MGRRGLIDIYSKWHWTTDADRTLCGKPIQLLGRGERFLPEDDDEFSTVTCRRCRARHNIKDQPTNPTP